MAQLTIYLDADSFHRIVAAAARENDSVSGWAKKRLLRSLKDQWPIGFFDLVGALGQEDFQRPPQPDYPLDSQREPL